MNFSAYRDALFKRLELEIPLNKLQKLGSCCSEHTASTWRWQVGKCFRRN